MPKIFYISDLHLRHNNVIYLDKRPFSDWQDMENAIINNWNKVVSEQDQVYILGDFCFSKNEEDWIEILSKLKGRKSLILGNHDLRYMSPNLTKQFEEITKMKEIIDGDRHVILCHYPVIFYRCDYKDKFYQLYGHLHYTIEEQFMQSFKKQILTEDDRKESAHKGHFYNCWCGFYNYTPVTLDQIIKYWKDK